MQKIESYIEELRQAVAEIEPLHPVFDGVFLEKRPEKFSRHEEYAPLLLDGKNITQNLEKISANKLDEELNKLRKLQPEAQADTFFYLLQKYGWRIGTPGNGDLQDVAFCDVLRTKLALANSDDDGNYLLVKGDLSGIQGYIYGDLQHKTAGGLANLSKRLRGRSIIVSLLTDFLASIILKELTLPTWHLLFAGGGHFNLLIPKSKEQELRIISDVIDKEMSRIFGDRLNLILAWIDCDKTIEQQSGQFFQKVNEEKEKIKLQQHRHQLIDHFYPSKQASGISDLPEEIELGTKFPKRKLLMEVASKSGVSSKRDLEVFNFTMHIHQYQLYVVDGEDNADSLIAAAHLLKINSKDVIAAQLFYINDTAFIPDETNWDYVAHHNTGFGFRFLGKNVPFHDKEKRPKTFEEICYHQNEENTLSEAEMKRGFLRLGALRLDVDDLGCIFSYGFGKNTSLGQIINLSRELHYFFTTYLDQIAQDHDIYVIYSGGDDAFVVGRWDKLIAFARQLRKEFVKWVFKNKDIHFSAGIFLGDPRYPVGLFYRDAGDAQEKAKDHLKKNQIDLFDHTLSWEEFDSKIELGSNFADILDGPNAKPGYKLTLAFANKVLRLVKTSFHEKAGLDENGQKVRRGFMDVPQFSRNLASLHYLFARHGYTQDKLTEVSDQIQKQLTVDFIKSFNRDAIGKPDKAKQIRNYLVAFNYALYLIRSQKKSNKRHDG